MKRLFYVILMCVAAISWAYAKPQDNPKEICMDLVGRSITEGTDDGYYHSDWKWTIKQGEIKKIKVLSVRENTTKRYTADVKIRLSRGERSHAIDATLTVYYIYSNHGWEIQFVKSRGIKIVRTHRYDDCIRASLDYGGIQGNRVYLVNDCDITLEVGGKTYHEYGGWKTFSVRVSPHSDCIYDSMIEDFTIDYIELP